MATTSTKQTEFYAHELQNIWHCYDELGYAIIKDVLTDAEVTMLRRAVLDTGIQHGYDGQNDLTLHAFVEKCPLLLRLLDNERYLSLQHFLHRTRALTVMRSAAIVRHPGSSGCPWHTDWNFSLAPPQSMNQVLNITERPSGMWFYLNGSSPERGGLAVIERSHRMDWDGPSGYQFTNNRSSFEPINGEANSDPMNVPGVVPLYSEPRDMMLFAPRTYHAAFANQMDEPRLSCGLGLRAGRRPMTVPWDMPESARRFIETAPAKYEPYIRYYTGYPNSWRPDA